MNFVPLDTYSESAAVVHWLHCSAAEDERLIAFIPAAEVAFSTEAKILGRPVLCVIGARQRTTGGSLTCIDNVRVKGIPSGTI